MKINFLSSVIANNRWRRGAIMFAFLLVLSLALVPGAAQLKQKRVTSLVLGDSPEGARVTVVSDGAVNDYEAFRRGDRFYVKIPLAELAASAPGFRGDGFEDIQIQKIGDSVVVSFKLQPGATARVDQRGNRLDVIFSSPTRLARLNTSGDPGRGPATSPMVRVTNPATQQRNRDSAGPSPATASTYRSREVSPSTSDGVPTARGSQVNPRYDSNAASASRASSTPASRSDSSTVLAPTASPTYPTATTAPAPVSSRPATSLPASSSKGGFVAWISTNRLATLVTAFLLLGLIAYAVVMFNRRRKTATKTARAKIPRAQPRYTPDLHLDEKVSEPVVASELDPAIEFINNYKFKPTSTETAPTVEAITGETNARTGQEKVESNLFTEPVIANSFAAAASTNNAWLTRPSIGPASTGHEESVSEDQEREVFEL
ncbi:MAG TPA: hypothetical protein VGW36_07355 [Pyrinomonadaceae bacterium]|nr:hypothetical protein [Pyrinomonadaceae bacterium]